MINRREFVRDAATAAGALALSSAANAAQRADRKLPQVPLGKTGIKLSLIGIGTGTVGAGKASNQTRLGQDRFTAMLRHAYDRGITYYDCADQYGSNPFVGKAIKGLPRNKLTLLTKTNSRTPEAVRADVERFLGEFETDYIDIVLLHCMMQDDWNVQLRGAMDALSSLKKQGKIRAHGVSCHTFGALETAAAEPWVDVDLARYNPWGRIMDVPPGESAENSPPKVRAVLQKMRDSGKGIIGMKVLAEGRMARGADKLERANESIKFTLQSGVVHAMVIGFESEQQIDEIVGEAFKVLDERRKR